MHRLSAKSVEKAKEPGYYCDGGLYLQVSKTLSKSWIFLYRRDGKSREMGLGSERDVSLAQAVRRPRTRAGTSPMARTPSRHERATELGKAPKGRLDSLRRVREEVHRRAPGRLAQREACGAVAEQPRHLCRPGPRRPGRPGHRHRTRPSRP
jgi:hypothetical protein